MSVPLSQILSDTTEKTRNSTTGALDNIKRTRAANTVLQDLQDYADWEFTRRTKTFYYIDGVSEYNLQSYIGCTCQDNDGTTSILDFKSPKDLRPVTGGGKSLDWQDDKIVRENVRRQRLNHTYGVDNGLLIVSYPRQASASIHGCDSLTSDGVWAASGDATNLTLDTIEFKEGSGCLNFDVSAGTSLILTNSTFTAKNLSTLENLSQFVVWVYLPTITNFTSVGLRWGSSASAYWEKTETLPAGNGALKVGWNRFAFRWASATSTGSPDSSAVDYLRLAITYSGATTATDFRVDDIRLGKEVQFELDYYSLAMVQDAAGDYQLEFNADSVTQTDVLLGGSIPRTAVVFGIKHELFSIIGGKREKDFDVSLQRYEKKKVELLKRAGHRIRRPSKVLNFPGERGGIDIA